MFGRVVVLGIQYEVYIYNTSQMSKLSLTLYTFSVTGLVANLFLIQRLIDE